MSRSSPRNAEGAPAQEPRTANNTTDDSTQLTVSRALCATTIPAGLLVLEVEVLDPDGFRAQPAMFARRCPNCRHAHTFRGSLGPRRLRCGGLALLVAEGAAA
ncbi:MAG: hypothetical protein ACRDRY_17810 [Pseudonocardiaceae bacterium]